MAGSLDTPRSKLIQQLPGLVAIGGTILAVSVVTITDSIAHRVPFDSAFDWWVTLMGFGMGVTTPTMILFYRLRGQWKEKVLPWLVLSAGMLLGSLGDIASLGGHGRWMEKVGGMILLIGLLWLVVDQSKSHTRGSKLIGALPGLVMIALSVGVVSIATITFAIEHQEPFDSALRGWVTMMGLAMGVTIPTMIFVYQLHGQWKTKIPPWLVLSAGMLWTSLASIASWGGQGGRRMEIVGGMILLVGALWVVVDHSRSRVRAG